MKDNELGPFSSMQTKYFTYTKHKNIKLKRHITLEHLEENIGRSLVTLVLAGFSNITLKAETTRRELEKVLYQTFKTFCIFTHQGKH